MKIFQKLIPQHSLKMNFWRFYGLNKQSKYSNKSCLEHANHFNLFLSLISDKMRNKRKHFTAECQVKRHCGEQIKSFCSAAYCVKRCFMVKLKLRRAIENSFTAFMKIR